MPAPPTSPPPKQTAPETSGPERRRGKGGKQYITHRQAGRLSFTQFDKRIAELSSDAASLTFKFGDQFRAWARAEADRRRRRKTVTLPSGTASFRDVPGRFAFKTGADEEAFVHARTHCAECIVTASPKLDRAAYIALAEKTGELFPGLETVAARESFALKFPGMADTASE